MRLRRRRPPVEVAANAAVELVGALGHGRRPALTHVDSIGVIERLRIVDVQREAAQWAELIRRHGVRPAENVVVLAERDRHWRSALLGVLEAGAVAVPCPAAAPPATIKAIAFDAGAPTILSARPRPDLEELNVARLVYPDSFEPLNAAERMPHPSSANDLALILYAHDESGLHAAEHAHASLLYQAAAADWLGAGEGQCVWSTTADGSHESIWLLLAAWHRGAEILTVDGEPAVRAALELIDQFAPAVVWFSDDEYATLADAEVPPWIDVGRVQRALTTGEPGHGANAFAERFAMPVVPVFASAGTGVVEAEHAAARPDPHIAEASRPAEAAPYERDEPAWRRVAEEERRLRREAEARKRAADDRQLEDEQRHAESGPRRQTDDDRRGERAGTEALAPDVISSISRYGVTGLPDGGETPGPPGPDERRLPD